MLEYQWLVEKLVAEVYTQMYDVDYEETFEYCYIISLLSH